MGKHAVQHHVDACVGGFARQALEIRFRAERRIDLKVVAHVVFVVAAGAEDRVEVNRADSQILQIGKLFAHALQIAAEEIDGFRVAVRSGGAQVGQLVPAFVQVRAAAGRRIGLAADEEAVDHDLHHHAVAHPFGRFERGVVHGDLERRRLVVVAGAYVVLRLAGIDAPIRRVNDEIVPQKPLFAADRHVGLVGAVGQCAHRRPFLAAAAPQAHERALRLARHAQAQTNGASRGHGAQREAVEIQIRVMPQIDHSCTLSRCHTLSLYSPMVRSLAKIHERAVLMTALRVHARRSR